MLKVKNKRIFLLQILFMLLLCYIHALTAGHTCDFSPINGTFQNFNPVRRLLSGQIPYRDFSDYLGLGHLYIGSFFTFLFGRNYQASLIAFSFLTIFSFALLSLSIGFSILHDRIKVFAITNIFLVVLLQQPAFYANGSLTGSFMKNAMNAALTVGNSARFVRGMILPIFVFLFLMGSTYIKAKKIRKYDTLVYSASFGFLASFAIFWSNDYGISSFVCASIGFLWCSISKWRSAKKVAVHFLVFLDAVLCGTILFGELLTAGHFGSWLKNTFGTGDFQRWYYLGGASSYVFEIDMSFLTVTQLLICFIYAYFIFISRADRKSLIRFGIPCFCNLTSYCAVNEYKLLSGGLIYEVAYSALFLTLAFEVASFLKAHLQINVRRATKLCCVASSAICASWLAPNAFNEAFFRATAKPANCIVELGGGGGIFV